MDKELDSDTDMDTLKDELVAAEQLSSALDAKRVSDPTTQNLAALELPLMGALQQSQLTDFERQRIYANTLRLLDSTGMEARFLRAWQSLHLSRRSAVIGGVAAGALAAAIGYAVIHERRHHRVRLVQLA